MLEHKYWVDEFYGAVIVKPLLALSRFVLEWVVEYAILGGIAWLLAGSAMLSGAILQKWQSGQSALVCGMAGGWGGGAAAVRAG